MSVMIEQMLKNYDVDFEFLTEGYFGYSTTYTGWLWEKAILYIWNSGDIVYRISC